MAVAIQGRLYLVRDSINISSKDVHPKDTTSPLPDNANHCPSHCTKIGNSSVIITPPLKKIRPPTKGGPVFLNLL